MKKKYLFWILLSLTFLGIDIASKYWTYSFIPKMSFGSYPYGGIPVFSDFFGISFSLNHVENLGAAWGVFAKHCKLLLALRLVVIFSVIAYLLWGSRKYFFGLVFIITGAIGNIIDFFFYGHVIDMLHFNFWGYSYPVFNIADCMITAGIFLVMLSQFLEKKKKKKEIYEN